MHLTSVYFYSFTSAFVCSWWYMLVSAFQKFFKNWCISTLFYVPGLAICNPLTVKAEKALAWCRWQLLWTFLKIVSLKLRDLSFRYAWERRHVKAFFRPPAVLVLQRWPTFETEVGYKWKKWNTVDVQTNKKVFARCHLHVSTVETHLELRVITVGGPCL